MESSLSVMMVPSGNTCPGNLTLHSSHSRAFQQYVFTYGPSFLLRLELSHSRKHSKCIWLIVPAHLHGDIIGSPCSFSSPKHILQTLPSHNFAYCYNFNRIFNLFLYDLLCFLLFLTDLSNASCSSFKAVRFTFWTTELLSLYSADALEFCPPKKNAPVYAS